MIIKVTTRDSEGNISFDGNLNSHEANLVLNVGINYLLAKGVMPMFTGVEDNEGIHPTPSQVQ